MQNEPISESPETQNVEISLQSIKSQNLIPNKTKTLKTMFKLPPYAFEFINTLSKIEGIDSVKEAIDIIVYEAKKDYDNNSLEFISIPDESIRKSVNISDSSKKILSNISKNINKSRDDVFYSAITNLIKLISLKKITSSEKIKYANILLNMAKKMLDIYYSDEAEEAREKLLASDDQDFGDPDRFQSCRELLMYVETLNELTGALEEFIEAKEQENEK